MPCRTETNTSLNTASPRSRHPGGVEVLMFDGSVRFVQDFIDLVTVWRRMATIDGADLYEDT